MLDIKVVHHSDFLKAAPDGPFEFDHARKLITQLAEINKPPSDYAILFDLRGAEGYASTADLYELACMLNEFRDSFRNKLAILVPETDSRRFANAEFFSLCAGNRGFRVETFVSFEDAMGWLSEIVRIGTEAPTGEPDDVESEGA